MSYRGWYKMDYFVIAFVVFLSLAYVLNIGIINISNKSENGLDYSNAEIMEEFDIAEEDVEKLRKQVILVRGHLKELLFSVIGDIEVGYDVKIDEKKEKKLLAYLCKTCVETYNLYDIVGDYEDILDSDENLTLDKLVNSDYYAKEVAYERIRILRYWISTDVKILKILKISILEYLINYVKKRFG